MTEFTCIKCRAFHMLSEKNGYITGICEECFNKNFQHVYLTYEPNNIKLHENEIK